MADIRAQQCVPEVSLPLIEQDLPALWAISELQGAASESQQIAYELYSSSDQRRFRACADALRDHTTQWLRQLAVASSGGEGRQADFARQQVLQRDAERVLQSLEEKFASRPVDSRGAHAVLEQRSSNASERKRQLDSLAGGIRVQAEARGRFRVMASDRIAGNAARVSLLVGTVLNLINQGDYLFSGEGIMPGHLLLNYLVPYGVASYSGACAVPMEPPEVDIASRPVPGTRGQDAGPHDE